MVEAFGLGKVLEPVRAEIADLDGAPDGVEGGRRDQRLSAVGGGRDPRRQMGVEPEVAGAVGHDHARVQSHPHAQRSRPLGPGMVGEAALRLGRGRHGFRRIREDGDERVPFGVVDVAVVREDRAADDVVVGAYRLHPARLPQATGELG